MIDAHLKWPKDMTSVPKYLSKASLYWKTKKPLKPIDVDHLTSEGNFSHKKIFKVQKLGKKELQTIDRNWQLDKKILRTDTIASPFG